MNEQTPKLSLEPGKCRECGCTEWQACPGGCWWVDPDRTLCSQCAGDQKANPPHLRKKGH